MKIYEEWDDCTKSLAKETDKEIKLLKKEITILKKVLINYLLDKDQQLKMKELERD